jgi:hypothetical protein
LHTSAECLFLLVFFQLRAQVLSVSLLVFFSIFAHKCWVRLFSLFVL